MIVKLLRCTPDPDLLIEECSRACYDSRDKMGKVANEKFIRSLIIKGHLSVLEHASATFEFDEVSRALTHQLVRHRLSSYSHQSQRYTKMDRFRKDGHYVMPFSICENEDVKFDYHDHMDEVEKLYDLFVQYDVPKEDARMILPNATHTNITMTANFRQWRLLLDVRGDSHAQWEIRKMAIRVWKKLKEVSPICFGDYRLSEDGTSLIRPQYISPDSIIHYKGEEFNLRDLIDAYRREQSRQDEMLR